MAVAISESHWNNFAVFIHRLPIVPFCSFPPGLQGIAGI
jgi:hypothetical protein